MVRAALGAALIFFLAGCQATLTAGVRADRDGRGVVSAGLGLDDAALRELGDPATELRLDDLRRAGWTVESPRREDDALTWVRVEKPFATPEQMSAVAAELSGPDGPFRNFRLTRSRSFLKTTMTFTGVVDLTSGLGGLSDPDLQSRLGDAPLPFAPESVRVRVDVQLPGRSQTWAPAVGERADLSLRSETWNLVPLVPAVLAVILLGAALALAVARRY